MNSLDVNEKGFSGQSSLVKSLGDNVAEVFLEPLVSGFGVTLGISMRRTLLSSIDGFAVVSIEIPGVVHEFSSIPGVREDVTDIILNVKSLVLRSSGGAVDDFIHLDSSPEGGVVTAGMIDTSGTGFDVVNKGLVICNVESGHALKMKMRVKFGVGYQLCSGRYEENHALDGVVAIDAIYSPVRKVSFFVEPSIAFVGRDRLVLKVETDGSISPEDAVSKAARILTTQLGSFAKLGSFVGDDSDSRDDNDLSDVLSSKIDEALDLSVRSSKCLKTQGILHVRDLVCKTKSDLLKTANFGKKSLDEINEELAKINLSLGMDVV